MDINKIAEKEGFRMLANDMVPVLNQIVNIICSHNLEDSVYIAVNPNGNISFSANESEWELIRTGKKEKFKLRCSISEEL